MLTARPVEKVSPGGLRRLLASQSEEWLERLDWDFTPVAELIGEAVSHGILRGVALVDGDEPAAYAVYTAEPGRCLVGEIYVLRARRTPDVSRSLVEAMLGHIPRAHGRRRIESQSVVFDARGVDEAFASASFTRSSRYYMSAEAGGSPRGSSLQSGGRISIRSWLDSDYGRAVEIVYLSYKGTADAQANVSYRTREGCADLLDAFTDSVWCGRFDPALTQVAVDAATGRACGVAVASRVSDSTAHLGQISVLPAYQGRGVGRALVEAALAGAALAGLKRVSLAVTRANERALRLYESCGFRRVLEFPVYYRG